MTPSTSTTKDLNWEEIAEHIMRLGIKSLTMNEIATILGVSKKTLYERVENKADLVRQVLHFVIDRDVEQMKAIHEASTDAIHEMRLVYDYIGKKMAKQSHSCMFDLKKYYAAEWRLIDDFKRSMIYDKISDNILRGQQEGYYRTDIDIVLIASLYRFVVTSITDDMTRIEEFSKEQLFKEFMKYHLHGISTAAGQKKLIEHGFLQG